MLIAKLKTRLVGLAKLKFLAPYETRKTLNLRIFNSVLVYCLPLFGGCDKGQMRELQLLQNKAGQIVAHKPPRTNRAELYDQLGWMTVNQLVAYHTLITVLKIRQTSEPEYLATILKLDNRNGKIIVPNSKIVLAARSFCYRGASDWNSLPNKIRSVSKIGQFKRGLKTWIMENKARFI